MSIVKISSECKSFTRFEEITWDQARTKVAQVKPELAAIIDEFNPGKNHTFIKAWYPFGVNIRDKGRFHLPTEEGNLATIDEFQTSADIRDKLGYSPSPLGLILDKAVEIYVETPEGRTIPFKLFGPGVTFGVWEVMPSPSIRLRRSWNWSISSGARTLFMLPKISDASNHLKLQRKYNVRSYLPHNIFEHEKIFAEISNHRAQESQWHSEILFFTKQWIEPQSNNMGWIKLKEYWAQEAWRQITYWSNKMIIDFNWEAYIAELTKRKIKLKPYLLDTVKHLILIGTGTIPAFKPTDDSQLVAPTLVIQQAYTEDYGLKTYAPVIMQPDFLLPEKNKYVYYSLHAPTLPEKPPAFENFSSVIKILRELKLLMDIYIELSQKYPKLEFSPGYDFLEWVEYDYFHTEIDPFGVIKTTPLMFKEDPSLGQCPEKFGKRLFPERAPFFRGCVRVSLKNSN